MKNTKTVQKVKQKPTLSKVRPVRFKSDDLYEEWGYYDGDDSSLLEVHHVYESEPDHRYFN